MRLRTAVPEAAAVALTSAAALSLRCQSAAMLRGLSSQPVVGDFGWCWGPSVCGSMLSADRDDPRLARSFLPCRKLEVGAFHSPRTSVGDQGTS